MRPWWAPEARGLIGAGLYALVLLVIFAMWQSPNLAANEFFKTIATLIIGAWIKDIVGWGFSATQVGGELAKNNATIVATQSKQAGPTGDPDDPMNVKEVKK